MISHAEWMSSTYDLLRKRSPELRDLDTEIKRFHDTKIGKSWDRIERIPHLDQALKRWKFSKTADGKNWRNSARNKKHAVELLDRQIAGLNAFVVDILTDEQADALEQHQATALGRMFKGKRMTTKHKHKVKLKSAAKNALAFDRLLRDSEKASGELRSGDKFIDPRKGLKEARHGADASDRTGGKVLKHAGGQASDRYGKVAAHTMDPGPIVRALAGVVPRGGDAMGLAKELQLKLGQELFSGIAHLAPGLGTLLGAKDVLVQIYAISKARNKKAAAHVATDALREGSARHALAGIESLLQRAIEKEQKAARVATREFVGGIVFPPAASALGAAAKAADFLATLEQMILDRDQMLAANKALEAGEIDDGLFEKSPILGAYFLACNDRSVILGFLVRGIGDAAWLDEIDALNSQIDGAVQIARQLLAVSRYEIPGIPLRPISEAERKKRFYREQLQWSDKSGNVLGSQTEAAVKMKYEDSKEREAHSKKMYAYYQKGTLRRWLSRPPKSKKSSYGSASSADQPPPLNG